MEGVLERAWNHPPLDKCLELVEDSTERSRRGVTERCARGFLLLRLTECTKRWCPHVLLRLPDARDCSGQESSFSKRQNESGRCRLELGVNVEAWLFPVS